eukprot:scaffold31057_cov29-Tisochrysis_lutea.AAC.5
MCRVVFKIPCAGRKSAFAGLNEHLQTKTINKHSHSRALKVRAHNPLHHVVAYLTAWARCKMSTQLSLASLQAPAQ